jgi:hypothetical protein
MVQSLSSMTSIIFIFKRATSSSSA